MCRPIQECPKCKRVKKMTLHHVLPKIFFKGKGEGRLICRECHNDLEVFIMQSEGRDKNNRRKKLPEEIYYELYDTFIKG